MSERKMSEVITILRKEKGIGQDELCLGICTQGTYSKFERGKQMLDRLLVNALLQRLGKASDKLEIVLSTEEYNYFQWKKQVLTAVGQNDMDMLESLLKRKEAVGIIINENLQKQFLYTMQAIVAENKENDIEKSITLLEQAADLTMPGIKEKGIQGYLISVEEMCVLLEWSGLLLKIEKREEAMKLLFEIVAYVDKKYDDYEVKVKIYPKAVKLLYPILAQRGQERKAMQLCKKAVDLLRWQGILYDLTDLMEGYLKCSRKFPCTEEVIRYEKQLQALKEVYEEYGAKDYGIENTRLSYRNQEVYLIDEMIKGKRLEKELSQEWVCEGICSVETLSRIENGKRTPSTKNFRALMERLETEQDYYNGTLETDDFLLLEKKKKLDRALALEKWDEACQILEYLKKKLDMSKAWNQKKIVNVENRIRFNKGELSSEEYIETCEEALGCEREGWREESFWGRFFTSYKMGLLSSIAAAYGYLKKNEEGIFILEHLLEFLEKSKVRMADRYQTSMTVVGNLSSHYGESGRLKECMEMCERGMKLCLESGRGVRLATFLGNKGEAMNVLANRPLEESKKYFKQAYYISDLMDIHRLRDYIDGYYRMHYEADIVWY